MGFPGGGSGLKKKTNKQTKKNLPSNAGDARVVGSIHGLGRVLEEEMATYLVFLSGARYSHGDGKSLT